MHCNKFERNDLLYKYSPIYFFPLGLLWSVVDLYCKISHIFTMYMIIFYFRFPKCIQFTSYIIPASTKQNKTHPNLTHIEKKDTLSIIISGQLQKKYMK